MPFEFPAFLRAAAAATGLILLAAPPAAAEVGLDWDDLALRRCAEPIMRNQQILTEDMVRLPEVEAYSIDFRSRGIVWSTPGKVLHLVHMEHEATDGQVYRGCRVDYDMTGRTTVPFSVNQAISDFEDWIEGNVDNRTFRDVPCPFADRIYARKIKTRAEVRPGVHLSIIIEAGRDDGFLFFAAVEEPVGAGECVDNS